MIPEPFYDGDYVTLGYLNNKIGQLSTELKGTNQLLLSKSQNFGTQPNPPYRKYDTYMSNDGIYICVNERLIGTYNPADWTKASTFVNVEDAIHTGITTDGTLMASNGGTNVAGLTGVSSGDSATRIWAGSTFANRDSAPFRVTQGGFLYANNANITGTITATSGSFSGTITSANATITGGSLKVGTNFEVDTSGKLKATNADITGKITATSGSFSGTISGATIQSSTMYTGTTSAGWMLTSDYIKARENGNTSLFSNGNFGFYGNHRIAAHDRVIINSQQGKGLIIGDGMINPTDGLVTIYASSSSYIHLQSSNGIRINGPISVSATGTGTRTNTYTGNPYYTYNNNTYRFIVINGLICGSERVS